MQPIDVLILVAGIALAVALLLFATTVLAGRKRRRDLEAAFSASLPDAVITTRDGWTAVETAGTYYLVKPIPFHPDHELILTNRFFWCVNADLKNWRRSTVPDLVPGVEAFVMDRPATMKKVVKVALLMPDCRNVTRYLNESDVEVVRPGKAVAGVHFVTLRGLGHFLSDREQK